MSDQITMEDFCMICGSLLPDRHDVTCMKCDQEVMGVMAHGAKMKRPRAVAALSPDGTIRKFRSMSDASKKTGVDVGAISRAAAGAMTAGGLVWNCL